MIDNEEHVAVGGQAWFLLLRRRMKLKTGAIKYMAALPLPVRNSSLCPRLYKREVDECVFEQYWNAGQEVKDCSKSVPNRTTGIFHQCALSLTPSLHSVLIKPVRFSEFGGYSPFWLCALPHSINLLLFLFVYVFVYIIYIYIIFCSL